MADKKMSDTDSTIKLKKKVWFVCLPEDISDVFGTFLSLKEAIDFSRNNVDENAEEKDGVLIYEATAVISVRPGDIIVEKIK